MRYRQGSARSRRQSTAFSSIALLIAACLPSGAARAIDLAGSDQTIGSLSGNGTVTNSGPGAATLTAGVDNSSTLFTGIIQDGAAATGLTKSGSGILTLSGSGSYSGATTVSQGMLAIGSSAALSGASNVTVSTGATLAISDSAAFATANSLAGGGTVNIGPTTGAGSLTLQGNVGTTFSGRFAGNGSLFIANRNQLTLTGTGGSSGTIGGDLQLSCCDAVGLTVDGTSLTVLGQIEGLTISSGTLTVTNGGKVTIGPTEGDLDVEGLMNITGAGSTVTVNGLTGIGSFGAGTLTVGSGGRLNSLAGAEIGADFGTPAATVTGAGSIWAVTGNLDVGGGFGGAAGFLTVANGGLVSASGDTLIGDLFDGTTMATVKGAGSTLKVGGQLFVGSADGASIGTLAIADGGSVTAASALVGPGSTLKLGTGGLAGSIATPTIENDGAIVADFTDALTLSATISGSGTLTKLGTGKLTLSGVDTYTGVTTINAGELSLAGRVAGNVIVSNGGVLSGAGTIGGNLNVGGTLAPGNSIGTLTVVGNYTQAAGSTYLAEVNAAGQGDLIRAGSATLQGGIVTVQPQAGTYRRTTVYTLVSTAGTVNGTYAGVTSSQARLVPTLGYGANGVTLSLFNLDATYGNPSFTPNQNATAGVLNQANAGATGDFSTVLNALSNLDPASLARALDAIGGQAYAGFGTVNTQTLLTFMDNFQYQAGGGRTAGMSAARGGSYTALAEACDIACDTVTPARWGAWGGGVGAFGTVAGNINSPGVTYNLGGFAAGLDRRFGDSFKAGFATGFSAASLYPQGSSGYGTSNTLQFALYGEYAEGPVYLDALAGYAHADNRMSRPIAIPGLPYRVAQGYTTANQFFGQLEAGYRLDVAPRFAGFVTPFARLQGSTSNQNGFSESGADSLDLNVAQQTTNALRSVLGAQLGAGIDTAWQSKLNLLFRIGWSHEYADLTRPVTAAFVGAPGLGFTTQGAIAPRDGVVLGLAADTTVGESTSLYFRYDGNLAGGNTNHALSAGLRFVW